MPLTNLLQQLTATVLIALLACPAWGQSPQVAGTVVAAQYATLPTGPVLPGSTIFSGESVYVRTPGRAQISLPGGGRLEILQDSTVQLARNSSGVQFTLQRGEVSFAGGPKEAVQTVLGDATVRPADPAAVGLLRLETADSTLLAAVKGNLTITTAHDGKSVAVPEGSVVRITLADAPQGEPVPAGKAPPSINKIALIAFVLSAVFLGAFLWIAAHEHTETSQQLASEISPYTLQ